MAAMVELTPAAFVVYTFGGVRRTARAIGISASSVSKWMKPREARGCGGNVPSRSRRLILEYAKKHDMDINSYDLDYGRKVKKPTSR